MSDATAAPPTELEQLEIVLCAIVSRYLIEARIANPNIRPLDAATDLILATVVGLRAQVEDETIRAAMLAAFVFSHEKPPSFIATGQAKVAIEHFASLYRKNLADQARLILPTSH